MLVTDKKLFIFGKDLDMKAESKEYSPFQIYCLCESHNQNLSYILGWVGELKQVDLTYYITRDDYASIYRAEDESNSEGYLTRLIRSEFDVEKCEFYCKNKK